MPSILIASPDNPEIMVSVDSTWHLRQKRSKSIAYPINVRLTTGDKMMLRPSDLVRVRGESFPILASMVREGMRLFIQTYNTEQDSDSGVRTKVHLYTEVASVDYKEAI
jgi:hypothetical protein